MQFDLPQMQLYLYILRWRVVESPSLILANWWNLSTNLYAKCVN
jgi:hypothetical protein